MAPALAQYFVVDTESRGYVSLDKAGNLLSFVALHLDEVHRDIALKKADQFDDKKLTRAEFVEL